MAARSKANEEVIEKLALLNAPLDGVSASEAGWPRGRARRRLETPQAFLSGAQGAVQGPGRLQPSTKSFFGRRRPRGRSSVRPRAKWSRTTSDPTQGDNHFAAGSEIRAIAPAPGAIVIWKQPPCISAIRLTILRPNPRRSSPLLLPSCIRAGAHPPSSETEKQAPGPAATRIVAPSPVCLIALSIRLRRAFSIKARCPRNGSGLNCSKAIFRPEFENQGREGGDDILRQLDRSDRLRRGHAGAFKPRQCRQLLNQPVERLQVLLDLARARISDILQFEARHSKRRPDFVRYRRGHEPLRLHKCEDPFKGVIHGLGVIGDFAGHPLDGKARCRSEWVNFRREVGAEAHLGARPARSTGRLRRARTRAAGSLGASCDR